jgi:sugar/nucleoside kinase (ribokinase family)
VTRFTVVGDTSWDVVVLQDRLGLAAGGDRPARIAAGPGGQGANVAVRLARRGSAVRLVTSIGADATGHLLEEALEADGVEIVNLDSGRSSHVVSLVDADGERAMVSDRVPLDLSGDGNARASAGLAAAEWIHVSGYPLADPASGEELATLAAARAPEQRCSLGGGSFTPGSIVGPTLRLARPDLLLFDRAEAANVLGPGPGEVPSAETLATALVAAYAVVAIVTDGPAGAAAATGNGAIHVPGRPIDAVDTTGSGDAHAAAVMWALALGPWPPSLEELGGALAAAGAVGGEVAGVPGAQARIPSEGVP